MQFIISKNNEIDENIWIRGFKNLLFYKYNIKISFKYL